MSQEINYDQLLDDEAFKKIGTQRIQAFKEMAETLKGKGTQESFALIAAFMKEMPQGESLTPQEQMAMVEVLKNTLSSEQRDKFNTMVNLINTINQSKQ